MRVVFIWTGTERMARMDAIKTGAVKDYSAISVGGIGTLGDLKFGETDREAYKTWCPFIAAAKNRGHLDMIKPEFLIFSNYCKWYNDNDMKNFKERLYENANFGK